MACNGRIREKSLLNLWRCELFLGIVVKTSDEIGEISLVSELDELFPQHRFHTIQVDVDDSLAVRR